VLGSIFRARTQIQFLADRLLAHQQLSATVKKRIIDFLCSESGSHDYTINRREAVALGLKVEKASADLYALLKTLMRNIRAEMEMDVPFELTTVLAGAAQAQYRAVRCIIESTAHAGHIYASEGELTKAQVQTPNGLKDVVNDVRKFEAWRPR